MTEAPDIADLEFDDEVDSTTTPADESVEADISAPAIRPRPGLVEQFVAVIRSAPCNGSGSDYTDARYYLGRAAPLVALKTTDVVSATVDLIPGVKECLTATNLAELADGTHSVAPGTLVQVFSIYTRGQPAAKLHVFNQATHLDVAVKITGNATGSGEYNGQILTGSSNATAGGALAMPAGMGLPGGDDALVINVEEDGINGHRLMAGTYAVGVVRGMTGDVPPRSIVVVRGGAGRVDSPTVLGGTGEGLESADSSNWSKASNGTPVSVYVVGRTVYNETGDKTLYSFVRPFNFDARGLLVSIGGESRVTVDITEACP